MRVISKSPYVMAIPADLRWPLVQAIYLVAAVTLGVLTGKLIEMPALTLRERLFPARPDRGPQPAPLGELIVPHRVDAAV